MIPIMAHHNQHDKQPVPWQADDRKVLCLGFVRATTFSRTDPEQVAGSASRSGMMDYGIKVHFVCV